MDDQTRLANLHKFLAGPLPGLCEWCGKEPYTALVTTSLDRIVADTRVCEACRCQAMFDSESGQDDLILMAHRPLTEDEKA